MVSRPVVRAASAQDRTSAARAAHRPEPTRRKPGSSSRPSGVRVSSPFVRVRSAPWMSSHAWPPAATASRVGVPSSGAVAQPRTTSSVIAARPTAAAHKRRRQRGPERGADRVRGRRGPRDRSPGSPAPRSSRVGRFAGSVAAPTAPGRAPTGALVRQGHALHRAGCPVRPVRPTRNPNCSLPRSNRSDHRGQGAESRTVRLGESNDADCRGTMQPGRSVAGYPSCDDDDDDDETRTGR